MYNFLNALKNIFFVEFLEHVNNEITPEQTQNKQDRGDVLEQMNGCVHCIYVLLLIGFVAGILLFSFFYRDFAGKLFKYYI